MGKRKEREVEIRALVARKIFGLKRVQISKRKHFIGAVFYGAQPPNDKACGLVPEYEQDWNETAHVIHWLISVGFEISINLNTVIVCNPLGDFYRLNRSKSLPLDICRLALLTLGVKT